MPLQMNPRTQPSPSLVSTLTLREQDVATVTAGMQGEEEEANIPELISKWITKNLGGKQEKKNREKDKIRLGIKLM